MKLSEAKRLLLKKRVAQQLIADYVGIGQSSISAILRGETEDPAHSTAVKLIELAESVKDGRFDPSEVRKERREQRRLNRPPPRPKKKAKPKRRPNPYTAAAPQFVVGTPQ